MTVSSVLMMTSVLVMGSLSMSFLIWVSLGMCFFSMCRLMVFVSLMDLCADNLVIIRLSMQRQGLVNVTMLHTVLGRGLDLMEKLIVLVLNVVHDLGTSMVTHIVLISVTRVIGVCGGVVAEILILFVMVIIVIASPVCATLVMLWVLVVTILVVGALVVLGAVVLVTVVLVVVTSGVLFAVVESVLAVG